MKFRIISLTLLMISLSVFIFGCSNGSNQKSSYETIVQEITNPEYKGRLTGTVGNDGVQTVIKQHFKTIGLLPYDGGEYPISYSHQFFNPDKQILKLAITYKNGSSKDFKYGIDFLDQLQNFDFNSSSGFTFDVNDPGLNNKIVILSNPEDLAKLTDKKPQAILIKTAVFRKYLPSHSSETPVLQISKEVYKMLENDSDEIDKIDLSMKLKADTVQASNIVGMLKGEDEENHEDAIVISAHFDSVGWINGLKFNGAMDNATGVSAMIQLAYFLKQYSESSHIHSDLIFAAFNGEESGEQGSEAFVQQLSGKYNKVYNINLDTIGVQDGGKTLIVGESNSKILSEAIEEYFNEHSVNTKSMEFGYSSDHLSFSDQNIQAITITQENLPFIHTAKDTQKRIDYDLINNVVTAVSNFLIDEIHYPTQLLSEANKENDEVITQTQEVDQRMDVIMKEREQLEFGQYKMLMNSDETPNFIIRDSYVFLEREKIEKAIQNIKLQENIMGYPFYSATVYTAEDLLDWPRIYKESELNKIYTISDIAANDLRRLELFYKNKEGNGVQIVFSKEPFDNVVEGDTVKVDQIYNNQNYQLIYNKKLDQSLSVIFDVTVGSGKYYVQIIEGTEELYKNPEGTEETSFIYKWKYSEKDRVLKMIDGLNLKQMIKDIGI